MSTPLLITRLSLSSRSAIGIQTQLIMDTLPDSQHLFWDSHDIGLYYPRSKRAESLLFSCATRLRYEVKSKPVWDKGSTQTHQKIAHKAVARMPKMGFSWWEHNTLKPSFGKSLQKRYVEEISSLYLAPMSNEDSERMQSLLQYLDKPFVVHLWDILDKDQIDCAAFQWMLTHAAHVFCLSQAMIDYIRPLRADATTLPFARKESSHFAKPRSSGPLRIALIGTCYKYRDGLFLLEEAISLLEKQGLEVEVVYVGPRKNLSGWSFSQQKNFRATGFMTSDSDRDRALAECHIGFLPGPLAPPAENMYSRFSIPSRILDYMATALPLASTVHPQSATADYMRDVQMEGAIAVTAAELAEKLAMLARPDAWTVQSEASLSGFRASQQEQQSLAYWLKRAAATKNSDLSEHRHAEV
jgi:hypothetical protein